jgi:N,N'-diacetyllegionaminate synthase
MSLPEPGQVDVAGRTIGPDSPVFIIAEMACGHQGDPALAEALVDSAVAAGADAIQFELFNAAANMVSHAPMYPVIERLQFEPGVWEHLFQHARRQGIAVSAFVYDPPSLALAEKLAPDMYKLNSSDLAYPAMLEGLARTGLPATLGTGASTFEEIAAALACYKAAGGSAAILMHGVQAFPTELADANIARVEVLRRAFGTLVGYADHTSGDDERAQLADLLAIGAGAVVVEKHIIMQRFPGGIDSQAALEPDEFRAYVARVRSLDGALGARQPLSIDAIGQRYRRFQKKVAVARADLPAGQSLDPAALDYLRHPDCGMSPMQAEALQGRRLCRAITAGGAVQEADLDGDV